MLISNKSYYDQLYQIYILDILNNQIKTILYIPSKDSSSMNKDQLQCRPSISDLDFPMQSYQDDHNNHEMKYISLLQINPSIQQLADYCHHEQQQYPAISQPSIEQYVQQSLHQSVPKTPSKKKKNGCVCKKTNCLKLYCQCFASGKLCTEQCSCFKCCNAEDKLELTGDPRFPRSSKNRLTQGCNCKKSNCQKKYCECYNAGLQCTSRCNCCNCHNVNTKTNIDSPNNKESQLSQRA